MESILSIQINVINPKPKQILRQITRDVTIHVLAISMEKQMHTTCSFTSDWLRNCHQIFLAIHTQYKTKVITAIVDSQLGEPCRIEQMYNKLCNHQPIKTRHFTASIYFLHEVLCVLNQKSSDS